MYLCKQSSVGIGTCLSLSTKSPVVSYLGVYVMETLMKVLTRGEPRDVCVWAREIKGVCVCVCALSSPGDTSFHVYVCICMLPLNDCDYIRQLLYCKLWSTLYWKQSRILTKIHHETLSISSFPISPHKDHPQDSITNCN